MSVHCAKNAITVAVAGLGRAGWDLHVAELRADRRFRIVAAADPDAGRRRQAEDELGCAAGDELPKLLRKTSPELVVVASPSSLHAAQVATALRAGCHVVIEKPMATSLRAADRMIAAARRVRRRLFPYHRRRFLPEFTFLEDVLAEGLLGKCFHIGFCSHNYYRRYDWQCLLEYGGGQLNNTGSHFLDLVLALLDAPVSDLLCDMKRVCAAGNAEDHIKILLRTARGMTADLEISAGAATERQAPPWTLLGTRGALTIGKNGLAQLKYYNPKDAPPVRLDRRLAVPGREYILDRNLPWKTEERPAQGRAAGTFYDGVFKSIRHGAPFRVKPEEVREMIRLIDLCRRQNPAFLPPNGRGTGTKHYKIN